MLPFMFTFTFRGKHPTIGFSQASSQKQRVQRRESLPPSHSRQDQDSRMTQQSQHLNDCLPTERKLVWRTPEERRMSDLTWVLDWLERRQGKKKQALQNKPKVVTLTAGAAPKKEVKKTKNIQKQQGGNHQVAFSEQASRQTSKDEEASILYRRLYRVGAKGKHLGSLAPGSYSKKADLDIKDAIAQESTQRSIPYLRQSIKDSILQDPFAPQKSTLWRDWMGKMPDISYERKLRSLMEKGMEPKMDTARMLKPEEVLSCRYLRLSKNNIRTLLKLCRDAGMNVDIHPHMVEGEIDTKKVFSQNMSVAL
uniref:Chromosome 6 C16orf78 homolog n=2 Tax=Sus scrofa TaxID=9823 RepID=F1REZ4_PIG